jgi:hypothetical protein
LIANRAQPADVGQVGDELHVVLADPEGNEFCVIEPGNCFLASRPRLGAVSCDGTKDLGYFFSDILGWPLVSDQDEETAIQSPIGDGPKITWSGPPLMAKSRRERIHFHVTPAPGTSDEDALADLLRLGVTRLDHGGHRCAGAVARRRRRQRTLPCWVVHHLSTRVTAMWPGSAAAEPTGAFGSAMHWGDGGP